MMVMESERRWDALHIMMARLRVASDKFHQDITPFLEEYEKEKQAAMEEYRKATNP